MLSHKDQNLIKRICRQTAGDAIKKCFGVRQAEIDNANCDQVGSIACEMVAEYDIIRQRVLTSVSVLDSIEARYGAPDEMLYDATDQAIDAGMRDVAIEIAGQKHYNVRDIVFGGQTLYFKIEAKTNKKYQEACKQVEYLCKHGLNAKYDGYKVVVRGLTGQKLDLWIVLVRNEDGTFDLHVEHLGDDASSPMFLSDDDEIEFLSNALPIMEKYVG